ncbi:MAG: DUF6880 family protein [Pseudomonadota bacterium]
MSRICRRTSQTCDGLGKLAFRAESAPVALADQCVDGLFSNVYAQFDGLIPVMADVSGTDGLKALKTRIEAKAKEPRPSPLKNEARVVLGWSTKGVIYEDAFAARRNDWVISSTLKDIADALGDIDAYMAQYDAEQRKAPRIAVDIARRLLDGGRANDAMALLESADTKRGAYGSQDWEGVYLQSLDAVGRAEDAQALRWEAFEKRLDGALLKAYLANLPDFEDVEAEERAITHARGFSDPYQALHFLVHWPVLETAADLVLGRPQDIDGDAYYVLAPAAEKLAGKYPLAATLLLRAMIDFMLKEGRSKRYKHAARHLLECESLAGQIADYGAHKPNRDYLADVRDKHSRKRGFWSQVG